MRHGEGIVLRSLPLGEGFGMGENSTQFTTPAVISPLPQHVDSRYNSPSQS